MSTPRRWPLHPRPTPGEVMSSCLHRMAGVYRLDQVTPVGADCLTGGIGIGQVSEEVAEVPGERML